MTKCQCKNTSQGNMALQEPRYPITASPEYSNIPEEHNDLNSHLVKMIEIIKEEMINPLKKYRKIQSNR